MMNLFHGAGGGVGARQTLGARVLRHDLLRDLLPMRASRNLSKPTRGRRFLLSKDFHEEVEKPESLEYHFPCSAGIFPFYLEFSFLSLGASVISL